MSYYGELTTKERKEIRIVQRERAERIASEARERAQKRRRSAYLIARRERKVRTDGERAGCLLRGLQEDVRSFYKEVILVAGLKMELERRQERRRQESRYSYAEDDEPAVVSERPAVVSESGVTDEFLRATGMSPRSFLSRGHLKGMAYRLRKLGEYVETISDTSSLKSEYRSLIKDLQKTGIYRELAKLSDKL